MKTTIITSILTTIATMFVVFLIVHMLRNNCASSKCGKSNSKCESFYGSNHGGHGGCASYQGHRKRKHCGSKKAYHHGNKSCRSKKSCHKHSDHGVKTETCKYKTKDGKQIKIIKKKVALENEE